MLRLVGVIRAGSWLFVFKVDDLPDFRLEGVISPIDLRF